MQPGDKIRKRSEGSYEVFDNEELGIIILHKIEYMFYISGKISYSGNLYDGIEV